MRGREDRHNITARHGTGTQSFCGAHVSDFSQIPLMLVVACAAPLGSIEPAPLTSMPLGISDSVIGLAAFWASDDNYFVRAESAEGTAWYRIEMEALPETGDDVTRRAMAELLADVTPIGGGRVAFPWGSSGRTVYRVWRSQSTGAAARFKIRAVRAARSRRLPA